ncbi:2-iminobutanoate/2-iminopropanoate deaminase [Motilibacter peucedani]|uniref:2-iminobutanoate/2-iminopropanoate deaminase n=1 Tax=Motilibacter peucedani TaxID=598650 RepID=A0A420XNL7_9ACTN|nr:Rid family hydrolase [Motilibacter peucedani]RKS73762.1 2-iminobutanoate/2-iminopropanoate deaminase [Motilibacter peucedani]
MPKQAHVSDRLPAPAGPYSQVVELNGLVFTAGFGPQDPQTGEVPEGVAAQTEAVLRNLSLALDVVGLTLADVMKTTVHLSDLSLFAEFNEVYARVVPAPYPVRTTVGSQLAGILVEIDAVAMRDPGA